VRVFSVHFGWNGTSIGEILTRVLLAVARS